MTLSTIKTHGVQFTEQAMKVLDNMQNRLHELRAWYGDTHRLVIEAQRSHCQALASLLRLGGSISSWDPGQDDCLSLGGFQPATGFSFGLIFHKSDFPDEAKMTGEDGEPFVIPGAPQPGTWSVHS